MLQLFFIVFFGVQVGIRLVSSQFEPDNIICYSDCTYSTITCAKESECNINCFADSACAYSTFNALQAYSANIYPSYAYNVQVYNYFYQSTIYGPNNIVNGINTILHPSALTFTCQQGGSGACSRMKIYANHTNNVTIALSRTNTYMTINANNIDNFHFDCYSTTCIYSNYTLNNVCKVEWYYSSADTTASCSFTNYEFSNINMINFLTDDWECLCNSNQLGYALFNKATIAVNYLVQSFNNFMNCDNYNNGSLTINNYNPNNYSSYYDVPNTCSYANVYYSTSPTKNPIGMPTNSPSNAPSMFPTYNISMIPTYNPSIMPINNPTNGPSNSPSNGPSNGPSNNPTNGPSNGPSNSPSSNPTDDPTDGPTKYPIEYPGSTLNQATNEEIVAIDDLLTTSYITIIIIVIITSVCVILILGCCSFYCISKLTIKQIKKELKILVPSGPSSKVLSGSTSPISEYETNQVELADLMADKKDTNNSNDKNNINHNNSVEIVH